MEREEKVTRKHVTERVDERQPARGVRSERSYSESRGTKGSETGRALRDVRDAGSDVWSGSCRLLSDLFFALGDNFIPKQRSTSENRSTFADDEPSRGLDDCVKQFGVVCRSFNLPGSRSDSNDEMGFTDSDRSNTEDQKTGVVIETEQVSERSTNRTAK